MEWQTKIQPSSEGIGISYSDEILSIGSCFAENIGQKFLRYGFSSLINPFGILFNPVSIACCINRILRKEEIREKELVFHDYLWHSYLHHGRFSKQTKEACLEACNHAVFSSHSFLRKTSVLIVTFGTSFVYHTKEGIPVANCHKISGTAFLKKLYEENEIISLYKELIIRLNEFNPKLKILFTVSPVRHWKDGYRENQISKSILHIAVHQLQALFPFVHYFPSYEIVMDELRDYRFYAEDMIHLTKPAVDFIWKKFSDTYFSPETNTVIDSVEKFRKMEEHRPLNKAFEKDYIEKIKSLKENLTKQYSFLIL